MTTAAGYIPISGNFDEDRDNNLVVPGPNAFFKISNGEAVPAADDYAVASGNAAPRPGNVRWLFLFLTGDRSAPNNDLFKVTVRCPFPFTQAEVDANPMAYAPVVFLSPTSTDFYVNSVLAAPPTVASLFDVERQTAEVTILADGSNNADIGMIVDIDFSHSSIS